VHMKTNALSVPREGAPPRSCHFYVHTGPRPARSAGFYDTRSLKSELTKCDVQYADDWRLRQAIANRSLNHSRRNSTGRGRITRCPSERRCPHRRAPAPGTLKVWPVGIHDLPSKPQAADSAEISIEAVLGSRVVARAGDACDPPASLRYEVPDRSASSTKLAPRRAAMSASGSLMDFTHRRRGGSHAVRGIRRRRVGMPVRRDR
jgi:hypothetical protein